MPGKLPWASPAAENPGTPGAAGLHRGHRPAAAPGEDHQALPKLTARLNPQGFPEAAEAIMTTDTRPKIALLREKIDGRK